MGKRFQSRRSNGRFQRNTLENTFGLRANVCESCRRFNPTSVGDPLPKACAQCGWGFDRGTSAESEAEHG
jgi:hypothetical protein